jgi:hypothetical protein
MADEEDERGVRPCFWALWFPLGAPMGDSLIEVNFF